MTATVHVLHVQTQQDPSVVHVTVLTLEMEKLAILYQQVIIFVQFEEPCYAKTARQSMQRVIFFVLFK